MKSNDVYRGSRTDSCTNIQVLKNDSVFDPKPSQKLWNHSPDGFNWGYHGSGPAQLALAILLDVIGDQNIAISLHQHFKNDVVSKFGDTWEYSTNDVRKWVKEFTTNESNNLPQKT